MMYASLSDYSRMRSLHGFTLVELSIVLVILGLLVGGVLTGQSLIRAAELRSITTQYNNYVTAVNAFKDKYFAVPGDMSNATAFWGAAHATPATCITTVGTGTQTCNGDGNSNINPGSAGSNEIFRFWQHLANAGLIEGSFNGVQGSGGAIHSTTANSPTGKISSGLWFTYYGGTISGNAAGFDGEYGNYLLFGGAMSTTMPVTPLLKPEELWNLDVKMDDGKPGQGKLVVNASPNIASCTDTGTTSNITANYLLNGTIKACNPLFRQAF